MWYREVIGRERCPIVDTWWQTETGRDHDRAAAGRDTDQARLGDAALPRRHRRRSDATRASLCRPARAGTSVIKRPWPSMLRTIYGDPDRYVAAVLVGDTRACTSPATAREKTKTGTSGYMGRVDDVMNVSGHRLSTMEVESALVAHPKVAEAAVVARPDE